MYQFQYRGCANDSRSVIQTAPLTGAGVIVLRAVDASDLPAGFVGLQSPLDLFVGVPHRQINRGKKTYLFLLQEGVGEGLLVGVGLGLGSPPATVTLSFFGCAPALEKV